VTTDGPLHGIRVLDITAVVMGPLATQILGDLGADVVTVEHARGDRNRTMGAGPHPQLSGISLNLLRNKRNISVDVATDQGRDIVLRLAATCDVVVTNLRPGSLTRLGLDFESVRAVRADVVYCQAAGYPSDGPRADDPAYDDVIQAATGVADVMEVVAGHPTLVPTLLADKVAGLTIVYAVCAALVHRAAAGEGQRIEVPMVDVMTSFMLTEHGSGAISEPPQASPGYQRILTAQRRPKRTADGWIHVLPYSRDNWTALLHEVGRDDVMSDPRFVDIRARHEHSEFLYGELEKIMPAKTTAEWLAFCKAHGVPATEIGTLDELVSSLPLATHPVVGTYRLVPPPVRFSATPAAVRRPAPLPGEHNRDVLGELGFAGGDIDALESTGVLRSTPAG
jgi:crotonobetainyl-CoA:carnitine CoA-transferase CaiB-like acyl-CoA transferase